MMSNQPETFTCHTCGHSWKKGQSGSHNCADLLIKKVDQQAARIAKLEQQLAASIERENGSDIAADMAMNSVNELQTRTIQQATRIADLDQKLNQAIDLLDIGQRSALLMEWSQLEAKGIQPPRDSSDLKADKATAVIAFVNMMIGALECGFVDDNRPTLAKIHQVARHHIKDNYGIDHPNITEEWGQDVAELCGIKPQEAEPGSA